MSAASQTFSDLAASVWSFGRVPLTTLLLAVGGVWLAWAHYNVWSLIIPVVGAGVAALAILVWWIGLRRLPDHPIASVRLLGSQVILLAAFTIVFSAAAIVIGLEIVAPEPAEGDVDAERLKAIVAAIATALAAFVTSLVVEVKDIDTGLADRIAAAFQRAYPRIGTPEAANPRTHPLPAHSPGEYAVWGTQAIPDWSPANRLKRAKIVAGQL